MRRSWIVVGLVIAAVSAGAAVYYNTHWKVYNYNGTRLMADLGNPDALVRTSSLSKLPHDLLKIPVARDVLTEDLVFYYEQHEDRLGLNGAIKRIAFEHQLDWTDRLVASAMDEPAEVALWRDGKGALRHYAIVMHRDTLAKVLQEAATVALKDQQLKLAGEIDTDDGKAKVLALEINPHRTLLLIAQNDRIVVLSDPGLLFNDKNQIESSAEKAVASWLEHDNVLSHQFALDETTQVKPIHTLAIGASTLSLGYGQFMPGFKGLRFDYGASWTTSVWLDNKALPSAGLGDNALWRAAPANPSACMVLPFDWQAPQQVIDAAGNRPKVNDEALSALDGTAMACWYGESTLYSPVFIARLAHGLPNRKAAVQALASWAIAQPGAIRTASKGKGDVMIWRGDAPVPAKPTAKSAASSDPANAAANKEKSQFAAPSVATSGNYIVFSPDGALVDLVLDTLAHANPSVADQMPTSNATLALFTPQRLSKMAEREALAALSADGDSNLLTVAQAQLPPRMKALAAYPPYRLDIAPGSANSTASSAGTWQRVEWHTAGEGK